MGTCATEGEPLNDIPAVALIVIWPPTILPRDKGSAAAPTKDVQPGQPVNQFVLKLVPPVTVQVVELPNAIVLLPKVSKATAIGSTPTSISSDVAVIWAIPELTPVTSPVELFTVATEGVSELKIKVAALLTVPLVKNSTAVN